MAAHSNDMNDKKTPTGVRVCEAVDPKHVVADRGDGTVNMFQKFTDFIDEHIRLVRTSVSVTAAIGVVLIARSIRPFQKFHRVSDIPADFINKHLKLYGTCLDVKDNPVRIVVQHHPIVDLQRFHRRNVKDVNEGLTLQLAGLELHDGCLEFLRRRLTTHPLLRFQMLGVNRAIPNSLDCIVEFTGWKFPFRRLSLNEELLRQGLAKVASLDSINSEQALRIKITQRFLNAELRAETKSRGLWIQDNPTKLDLVQMRLRNLNSRLAPVWTFVRMIATLPWKSVTGLKRLFRRKPTGEG